MTDDEEFVVFIPERKEDRVKIEHTDAEWRALVRQHEGRCARCRRYGPLTRDHIVPVSKGGTDHIENIQPLCSDCNKAKGNKIHG